jgi:MOSC domain-containing protein YiiM
VHDSARKERVTGTVVQVSVSQGGIPKLAIPSAELTEIGVTGDAWRYPFHGGRRKAILLITIEGIDELISQGFPLFPGALGENLTTRGLDHRELRIGQRFLVGEAEIELTRIRTPCATLDVYGSAIKAAIYDARVQSGDPESQRWGLSGFYASVVQPGTVRAGDTIALPRLRHPTGSRGRP